MKLLIIFTTPLEVNGISNSVLNYCKYLNKSNMQIDIVAFNIIERIRDKIKCLNFNLFELSTRNSNPIKYFFELKKLIKNEKYDIVHAHGNSNTLALEMFAAKSAGCKIRIAHSHSTKCKSKILNYFLKPFFFKSYTHSFACSENAGKWLFKNNKFDIVKNGVDTKIFCYNEYNRIEIRKQYQIKENNILLGQVGKLNSNKNQDFVIDILNELITENKNYKIMFVGEGNIISELKQKVEKLGLVDNIIFVGTTYDAQKYYSAFDLFIMPSFFEGLPLVLIEAQCSGLKCIVSDSVTKEVDICNDIKFLSLNQGEKNWAKQIKDITLNNRELSSCDNIKCIKSANYDIEENAKWLERYYKKLINE